MPQTVATWGSDSRHTQILPEVCGILRTPACRATCSGYEQGLRRVPPDAVEALEADFADDERAQFRGEPPRTIAVVSTDPTVPASYRSPDAISFYFQKVPEGTWQNSVTVRSNRAARMYEPGAWIPRVSPTPLLLVVAKHDTVTLTDLALAAYERAHQPKKLELIPGDHFDAYLSQFSKSSGAARAWFRQHLC